VALTPCVGVSVSSRVECYRTAAVDRFKRRPRQSPLSPSIGYTSTHPFNGPFSGTTRVGRYQKCKTNLDFTEARDSEWQWHHLGHMQVCTSLQTDNHTSTPPLSFLQAGCPSCRPTSSVKAVKASPSIGYTNTASGAWSSHSRASATLKVRDLTQFQLAISLHEN